MNNLDYNTSSDSSDGSASYESTGPIPCSASKEYEDFSSSDDLEDDSKDIDVIANFPRVSLKGIEKQIYNLLETGKIGQRFFPDAAFVYLKKQKPCIWNRLESLILKDSGWGYLSQCLMLDLNTDYDRKPKNIIFDVCVFSCEEPIHVLTFTNRQRPNKNLQEYNSRIVNYMVASIQDRGLNVSTVYGVIEECHCQTEADFTARLDELKSDAKIMALSRSLYMDMERFKTVTRVFLDLVAGGVTLMASQSIDASQGTQSSIGTNENIKQGEPTGENGDHSEEIAFLKRKITQLTRDMKVVKWKLSWNVDSTSDTGYDTFETTCEEQSNTDEALSKKTASRNRQYMRPQSPDSTLPSYDQDATSVAWSSISEDSDEETILDQLHKQDIMEDVMEESNIFGQKQDLFEGSPSEKTTISNSNTSNRMSDKTEDTFKSLFEAVREKSLKKVMDLLSQTGISMDDKSPMGRTLILEASLHGHISMFEYLKTKGASLTVADDNKNTILNIACTRDNVTFVKYLLDLSILDINVRGYKGRTPIMQAACNGCREVFDLLLAKGADACLLDDDKNTIFHVACLSDNAEFVKYLLTLNIVGINVRGFRGRTPIMIAAAYGCRKVFDLLRDEGADTSVLDDDKDTILHVACLNDNAKFVKYLLTLNIVDINVRGFRGRTPIMHAAQVGRQQVFDLLKDEGVDTSVLDDNKDTIFHVACLSDKAEFVKYLLTLNIADINVRGCGGRTPIMIAAAYGCRKVFDLLKDEGADTSVLDDDKDTILHVACLNDNAKFVKYILTLNIVDINIKGFRGRTPIMIAAAYGCRKVFDLFKDEGADISVLDDDKNTIFHVACLSDNAEFVKYLLTLNILDINVRGFGGRTPIMIAAAYGCRKVFDLLKDEGADTSVLDDDKNTILHVACLSDNAEFVKYLLTLNIVDINVRGFRGRTPIMIAAENGCRKVFDLLKDEGADTSVLDDDKDTILHFACLSDNAEFVKYLLTLNIVDVNVRGFRGRTPIMHAAQVGRQQVFDLLKDEGADTSVLDDNKDTILHVACLSDDAEFVKYLLTLNIVDINVRGFRGRTPIMIAAENGCRKVFDLLKDEGADTCVGC